MNWKSKPDFIVYQLEGLPSFGTWLQRRRGRPLVVWTADTKAEYARAQQWVTRSSSSSGRDRRP